MSSSPTFSHDVLMPAARSAEPRWSIFRPLLKKELRESRNLLIAGLWTYWLMPALVEIGYFIVVLRATEKAEAYACAGVTVLLGWFFATIAGAQVVCRDWGRAEEHFLRAQPVHIWQVVLAKWIAGLVVVFVVCFVPIAWDFFLTTIGGKAEHLIQWEMLPAALLLIFMVGLGYTVAFVVSFATRQMLTGVLAGCMVLATCWVAPFISHRFVFIYSISLTWFVAFLFIIISGFAVALWAAWREMHLQLNTKAIAWTIAVLVLGAFGFALNEVGNSLTIRDVASLPAALQSGDYFTNRSAAVVDEHTAFIATQTYRPHKSPSLSLARLELASSGKIASMNVFDLLPNVRMSYEFILKCRATRRDEATITVGYAAIGSNLLTRLRVEWPSDGDPRLVRQQQKVVPPPLPSDTELSNITEGEERLTAIDSDRYTYLLTLAPVITIGADGIPQRKGNRTEWPRVLYVYDWSDEAQKGWSKRIPLAWPGASIRRINQHLVASASTTDQDCNYLQVQSFNPQDPETIEQALTTRPAATFEKPWTNLLQLLQCGIAYIDPVPKSEWKPSASYVTGSGSIYDEERGLVYLTTSDDFKILDQNMTNVGAWEFSPIASLFRSSSGQNTRISKNLVGERSSGLLSVFDVSNPHTPVRLGFFNLYSNRDVELIPMGHYLGLLDGRRVTILDLSRN